ncbi:Uncharacterized protein dnm_050760 [Desulfonema magnum]|uniref:Uncharacterized protein n=1 Tax=Desulfonema magnum TaxID=45655 RepID=A0A975BNM6_9BACT|nr:Uncharacterized protein dnm_050760 [Desulfonema magnum]
MSQLFTIIWDERNKTTGKSENNENFFLFLSDFPVIVARYYNFPDDKGFRGGLTKPRRGGIFVVNHAKYAAPTGLCRPGMIYYKYFVPREFCPPSPESFKISNFSYKNKNLSFLHW